MWYMVLAKPAHPFWERTRLMGLNTSCTTIQGALPHSNNQAYKAACVC